MRTTFVFLCVLCLMRLHSQQARDGYTVDVSTTNCGGGLNSANPCVRIRIDYDNDHALTGSPENCPDRPRGLQNVLFTPQNTQNYQYVLLFNEEFNDFNAVMPGQIRPSSAAPASSPVWNYNWDIYADPTGIANTFRDSTPASFLVSADLNQGNACGLPSDKKVRLRMDTLRVNNTRKFRMSELKSRFTFRYGYIEARVRIPKGQGLLPAFWTFDASFCPNGGFDKYNEFDVFEFFQEGNMAASRPRDYQRQFITEHNTSSYPCSGGNNAGPSAVVVPFDDASVFGGYYLDMSKDFFIYGMEWTADSVKYYLNNKFIYGATHSNRDVYQRVWLQNILMDSYNTAAPGNATPFPNFLEVDYVRAYKTKSQWQSLIGGSGNVCAGQSAVFSADYIPGASYSWFMTTNSSPASITLSPFHNYQWPARTVTAIVPASTPAGNYNMRLLVTLSDGTVLPATDKTIKVYGIPPSAPAQPAASNHTCVRCRMSVAAVPNATAYEWRLDGSVLSGSGTTINLDSGYYAGGRLKVRASNPCGWSAYTSKTGFQCGLGCGGLNRSGGDGGESEEDDVLIDNEAHTGSEETQVSVPDETTYAQPPLFQNLQNKTATGIPAGGGQQPKPRVPAQVSVRPNPVSLGGNLSVETADGNSHPCEIADMKGTLIWQGNSGSPTSLTGIVPGVYTVSVFTDSGKLTAKLIVLP